jgi:hypothetical protein
LQGLGLLIGLVGGAVLSAKLLQRLRKNNRR